MPYSSPQPNPPNYSVPPPGEDIAYPWNRESQTVPIMDIVRQRIAQGSEVGLDLSNPPEGVYVPAEEVATLEVASFEEIDAEDPGDLLVGDDDWDD